MNYNCTMILYTGQVRNTEARRQKPLQIGLSIRVLNRVWGVWGSGLWGFAFTARDLEPSPFEPEVENVAGVGSG